MADKALFMISVLRLIFMWTRIEGLRVKKCPCVFFQQAGKQGFKHIHESPSNSLFAFKFTTPLHDMSRVCDMSIVMSKMAPGLIPRIPTCHISHETYRRRHRTVTCSESKFKILRVKTITQGKCKSLVVNIILYETSYWGMSTLALPVFLTIQSNFAISKSS